jgi:hypothetical protein
MSTTTLIIGESGSGKSTSLRNLDPASTFILNVIGKPLPFRGFKKRYNAENKNYHESDDYSVLLSYIKAVNERRPDITTLIIDDFQYLLANEFMRRSSEKGYDRFTDIGKHAWDVIKALTETRPDLYCFVISHSDQDQNGRMKCKTIGKMLDDKITLEGMFTTVLHSLIIDGEFKFLTQHDGVHVSKSPMGLFEQKFIDNDLSVVIDDMKTYFNEETE